MKLRRIIAAVVVLGIMLAAYSQLTIFVIQPIGALPEDRTVITWRRAKTQFIDSADAYCQREMGSVNLLCRAAVLGGIAGKDGDGVLLRLPYSEMLYLVSTGGSTYEK